MDYLDEWKAHMIELKWRKGEVNNPYYKAIDKISQTIRDFYSPEDFSKEKHNPDNWILHILANKQNSSLFLLGEHASLIEFYLANPEFKTLNLKTKKGRVNHRELNEKLFELYVNQLFKKIGVSTQVNQHYLNQAGQSKPMDLAFISSGELINVEATKFYNPFKEEFLALARHVAMRISMIGNKEGIHPDELFSGYLIFKTRSVKAVRGSKNLFEEKINQHLSNFRNPIDNVIRMGLKTSNEDLEMLLTPDYIGGQENPINQGEASMHFRLELVQATGLVRAHFKSNVSSDLDESTGYLIDKIKEKIKQHRSFLGKKVIVIGIDNLPSTHQKGSTSAIHLDQVDVPTIVKMLPLDTVVLLVFRETTADKLQYTTLLIEADRNHPAATILRGLKNKDLIVF